MDLSNKVEVDYTLIRYKATGNTVKETHSTNNASLGIKVVNANATISFDYILTDAYIHAAS